MANFDTAAKRISGVHVGMPWRGLGYFPTGAVDQAERQAFIFLYSGILATAPIAVPDVDNPGTTQAAAESAITTAGLVASVSTAYSATVPAGEVISQDPAAGTSVAPGSTVSIVVSLGPEPVVEQTGGGGPDPRRKWEYEWELLTARMILARQEKAAAPQIDGVKSDVLDAAPEPLPQSIPSVQVERDYRQFAKLVAAYSDPPAGLAPKVRQAYIEARSRADRAAYEQLLQEVEAQRKREDDEFMFLAIEALKHWH